MYKQKLSVSVGNNYVIKSDEVVKLLKDIGFEGISAAWHKEGKHIQVIEKAIELKMPICSLHAYFGRAANMWSRDVSVSEPVLNMMYSGIDDCEKYSIPVMVVHTWIGFDYTFDGTDLYFENFEKMVSYAKQKGVKIAFENTEGIEYLFALMEHFKDDDTVGFCFDSGHQMCYNMEYDLLSDFGDRLLVTHLNDNLGCSKFDGTIYWTDDLHLLPYDGIADWDKNIEGLKKSAKLEFLNFELNIQSKPDRHDNDIYTNMDIALYFTEAYKRACKIAYRYAE